MDAELPDRFDFAVELGDVQPEESEKVMLDGDGRPFPDTDDSNVLGADEPDGLIGHLGTKGSGGQKARGSAAEHDDGA